MQVGQVVWGLCRSFTTLLTSLCMCDLCGGPDRASPPLRPLE